MKTAIVILNWNGRKFLEKFLPGLVSSIRPANEEDGEEMGYCETTAGTDRGIANGEGNCEKRAVIVADNASTDDSQQWLAENFPEIRTIIFDENYGFTGGYNRAFAQIKAQYYVLINSDVEVTDNWLAPLEEWMDNHILCGACAPKLLSHKDRNKFEYAGAAGGCIDRYGYPFCRGRVLRMTEKDFGQYDKPWDVLWASGACLMVRAEIFHRLGGLDERFFAHQEEIDLCWRMQLEGCRVTIVPASTVYHVGGGTLPNNSPWKLQLNFRNNLLMLDNNLARTLALNYFNDNFIDSDKVPREGITDESDEIAGKAARIGLRKAQRIISTRMVMDGCSAIVYLLSLRPEYFRAIIQAHREYRSLRRGTTREEIAAYVLNNGKTAGVAGIYPRWIVPQAIIRGKHIFRFLRSKI